MSVIRYSALVSTLGLYWGCGGAPIPSDQKTAAQASVQAAEIAGADRDPQAALHIKHAKDQIKAAEDLIADGDNERAFWLLRRAQVDAELAVALTKERETAVQAEEAAEKAERLKRKLKEGSK